MIYYPEGMHCVFDHGPWVANDPTPATAQANFTTLQTTIAAAQNKGGIVLIPCVDNSMMSVAGPFYLQSSLATPQIKVDTSTNAPPIVVLGYGGATTLIKQDDGDLFVLSNMSGGMKPNNLQGIIFRDLTIQYTNPVSSGIAFNADNATSLFLYRIYFQDCPNPVSLTDSLQVSMVQCTAAYSNSYNNSIGATVVALMGTGGPSSGCEDFTLDQCVFRVNSLTGLGPMIGILIQEADHGRFTDTSILGFTIGVKFNPTPPSGAVYHTFTNVSVNPMSGSLYGVLIEPLPTAPGKIEYVKFVGCDLSMMASDVIPAVYINQHSAAGGTVDTVEFVGCSINGFNGPAIWVADAKHIEITGGVYNNNAVSGTPMGQIALEGSVTGVSITGASCIGGNQYGISVTSGATNIYMRSCNLNGNSSGAIYFGSGLSGSVIEVTDCVGYNDQGPLLASTAPTSAVAFYNYTHGYYGPVSFYVTPGVATISAIAVAGHVTGLKTGAFVLAPGQSGEITWSGSTPPLFFMIGQ